METATDGITVNAICPGLVDTPFIQHQLDDLAAMHGLTKAEAVERVFLPLVPQRRMLEPGEIATMARYLASDEARGHHRAGDQCLGRLDHALRRRDCRQKTHSLSGLSGQLAAVSMSKVSRLPCRSEEGVPCAARSPFP